MATLQVDLQIYIECKKCGDKTSPKYSESAARYWAITNGWHVNYIDDTAICKKCRLENKIGIKK